MKTKRLSREVLNLALCIALFPPIWAVVAPYIGIQTGTVALICAGLYVTNGNKLKDALKITIGFLLGDCWAVITLAVTDALNWNADLELFITLFILGAGAVCISALLSKWIFCPALLCGWAIGLTIMAPLGLEHIDTLPFQIGVAMVVGVWYVGAFINWLQKKMEVKGNDN